MENVTATAAATASTPPAHCGYRWRTGECLADYCKSAKIWTEHTSSKAFADAFMAIIEDPETSNEERDNKVEEFLLTEAT